MTDPKLIAFYLPQFHPIPENDVWWGKGFTEWRSVVGAQPKFKGHHQPKLPADLGFYDLRVPETRIEQAELARAHGIHGFCYYYYWFSGRRLLERPLDEVWRSGKPDFPFCICWANASWNRRWDGAADDILMALDYRPGDDRRFICDVIPLFRDPRYIRIGDRPLLVVSRPQDIPEISRVVDVWKDECAAAGLSPPYLCLVQDAEGADPRNCRFDAAIEFPPHGFVFSEITPDIGDLDPSFEGRVWDYVTGAKWGINRPLPDYPFFRGTMAGWDNTPRLPRNGQVFLNAHPANYQRWLAALVAQARAKRACEERLIFINAWNEWAEGAYLEPDQRHGTQFLEATKRALDGP